MWLHTTIGFYSFKFGKIYLRIILVTTSHTCAQQDTALPPSALSRVGPKLSVLIKANSHHTQWAKFSSHLHGNGRTEGYPMQVTMSDFQSDHQN